MKKSRFIAVAIVMLFVVQTVASAFGGTYPTHPTMGYLTQSASETLSRNSGSASNSDYTFEVGGKKFILLDKDDEGNYFVLADDMYGQRAFDTSQPNYPSKPSDKGYFEVENYRVSTGEIRTNYNVRYEEFFANKSAEDLAFNTTSNTNIGYWLNNTFWNSGNGSGNALPGDIKDNIITATWNVEGMEAPIATGYANGYNNGTRTGEAIISEFITNWASKVKIEPYTVSAKLSLMSITEYKKYQDIIGLSGIGVDDYHGMMLRTPRWQFYTSESGDYRYILLGWGGTMVRNNGSGNKMTLVHNDDGGAQAQNGGMYVRPCFWLDKDFFKNVKIDFDSAGEKVLTEIRNSYEYEDLEELGYSKLELGVIFRSVANISFIDKDDNSEIDDISEVTSVRVSADFANTGEDCVFVVAVYSEDDDVDEVIGFNYTPVNWEGVSDSVVTKYVDVSGFEGATRCSAFVWKDLTETIIPLFYETDLLSSHQDIP